MRGHAFKRLKNSVSCRLSALNTYLHISRNVALSQWASLRPSDTGFAPSPLRPCACVAMPEPHETAHTLTFSCPLSTSDTHRRSGVQLERFADSFACQGDFMLNYVTICAFTRHSAGMIAKHRLPIPYMGRTVVALSKENSTLHRADGRRQRKGKGYAIRSPPVAMVIII